MIDRPHGRASRVADIESALDAVVTWSVRHDVRQEVMRRARCELPPGSVWMLARMLRCGPVRITDLAAALGVDVSTVTPQTKRLERENLIGRKPDPKDGRASLLYVTRTGRALLDRTRSVRATMLAELLSTWSDRDLAEATGILGRLAECLSVTQPA
jgi:DNA-binding MarR family transcriptional regulator